METIEVGEILTIGHSTLPYDQFLALLRTHGVTAVADVRTSPYSRWVPQFNQDTLQKELRLDGVSYVFLGNELGGRPRSQEFYTDGVADYERMASTAEFANALDRVVDGSKRHRVALLCSEADPLECHRCLLVGRALAGRGLTAQHILSSGHVVSQQQIEQQLLELYDKNNADLFASNDETLASAYRHQARKVAFAEPEMDIKKAATG